MVLDLTDEKGYMCGKILGDLGADVVKIEPPGGDRGRNRSPFYKDKPHPEKSLFFMFYNANKKGITLNLESREGTVLFKKLVKNADVVIESFFPGRMKSLGLSYKDLSRIKADLIFTSITPFGQKGPYKNYQASDLVVWALGGMLYLCGDSDRPPVAVGFPQAFLHASADGAAATSMALYHREMTGEGQYIDVSAQACASWVTLNALEIWSINQTVMKRGGARRMRPNGVWDKQIWRCKDGYIHFLMLGGKAGAKFMPKIIKWLDDEGLATDVMKSFNWKEFDMTYLTQELYNMMEKPMETFFARFTKKELYKEAIRRAIQILPVSTLKEVFEDKQLQTREFWEEVEHPELQEKLTYPGSFAKSSEGNFEIRKRPPLIGEHNEEIYCGSLGLSQDELIRLKEVGVI